MIRIIVCAQFVNDIRYKTQQEMKKSTFLLVAGALLLFSTSCGVSTAFVANHNQNSTQVHLADNNYQVIDKVRGSSEVTYVLVFGGMNKKRLYENAYADMVNKAELSGSRALINTLTEEHVGGFPPFYYTRTITVSAHVIEFTE